MNTRRPWLAVILTGLTVTAVAQTPVLRTTSPIVLDAFWTTLWTKSGTNGNTDNLFETHRFFRVIRP